jgi:hypothetical protein
MKNIKSLGLAVLVSCLTLSAQAKPVVTVADVYAQPNSTTYFTVNLTIDEDKVDTYLSFGCDLILPEGFTVDNDKNLVSPTWPDAVLAGTQIRTMSTKTLSGIENNGLFSIALTVGDLEKGDYTVSLENIVLEYPPKEADEAAADVSFTIHVSDVLTLNENSQIAPETTTTNSDVKVVRTLNAGEWSTICLPFALNAANIAEIFPDGCEIAELAGYDVEKDDAENIVGINVNFNPSTVIRANQPYIIKVNANVKEFTAKSKKVSSKPVATVLENDDLDPYATMTGTNVAMTVVPKNSLFLSDNKFYYSAGKTKIKAFRAYFTFMDILSSLDGASTRVKFFVTDGDETTEIKIPELLNDGEYYNLNGVRVETPSKGIYIKDGKKVVVK